METAWVADTDSQAAADALVSAHARLVEAEVAEFTLAAHWADLHGVAHGARGPVLPGTERLRRLGGDGTPEVGEFAAAELGCLIGRGMAAASTFMADALDVRHRLPQLWAALRAGRVRVWQAREVAKRTRSTGLSAEQARWVDSATTPYLVSLPWSRFSTLLDAKIVEVDPEAAERRRQAAALERFVVTGQCNEYGLKTIVAKATAGDAIFFVAMCDRVAQVLELDGDTDPVDVRRSKAIGILANPTRALALLARHSTVDADRPGEPDPAGLLPRATLYLHVSHETWSAALEGRSEGVVRMEGTGPLTVEQAREFLAHTNVTLRPVIDLDVDHPVDSYEVPASLREQLVLRSPATVFPFSAAGSRPADADHTVPYLPPSRGGPPGQTRIGNLGPLGRTGHRVKTHARGWRHRQPSPGMHLWRTPHGYWFRVDHAGTHPLSVSSPMERAFRDLLTA